MTDSLVWTTLLIFVWIRVRAYAIDYVPAAVAMLEKTNINILGGFLSFFLVLFVNQTNDRFLQMYGFSKACSGRIQDVAGLAKTQLPLEAADSLVRHFNAAHIAGYVGLNAIGQGSPYSKSNFFDHYNKKHKLLTKGEMEELSRHDMDNSGLCMKELVTWCQQDVTDARKDGHIDTNQEKLLHSKILDFRAAMDGMYDYTDQVGQKFQYLLKSVIFHHSHTCFHIIFNIQPPHFFYIHFLVLLSALYLPLFAVGRSNISILAKKYHFPSFSHLFPHHIQYQIRHTPLAGETVKQLEWISCKESLYFCSAFLLQVFDP